MAFKEEWAVFYIDNKEKCAYTVNGTFPGEMQATKELLAYENNVEVSDVVMKIEKR